MKCKKFKQYFLFNIREKGFTLIEIIVSISIFSILTAAFLANYSSSNKRSALNMAAQEIISNIRMVENYSLGTASENGQTPAGGWGIYFVEGNSNYLIFTDNNENKFYDEGEKNRDISLPPQIKIDDINISGQASITFLPPDPDIYITSNGSDFQEVVAINLINIQDNSSKIIRINSFGLAEVID